MASGRPPTGVTTIGRPAANARPRDVWALALSLYAALVFFLWLLSLLSLVSILFSLFLFHGCGRGCFLFFLLLSFLELLQVVEQLLLLREWSWAQHLHDVR